MEKTNKIRKRSEIPVEDTWATEDLFASDEAWEQELATIGADKEKLQSFAGRLGESADALYEYLSFMEKLDEKVSLLANYCMRKGDEDTRNPVYQAMGGKFRTIMVALGAAGSFETPEIMAISDETLGGFYAAQPKLERYRRYLTNMRRRRAHTLSAAEEKLLAAAGEMSGTPSDVFGKFSNADLSFPDALDSEGKPHPVSQGTFVLCEESTQTSIFRSFHGLPQSDVQNHIFLST